MKTYSFEDGKYEVDRDEQTSFILSVRRHGEYWPIMFEQIKHQKMFHAILNYIDSLESAERVAVPGAVLIDWKRDSSDMVEEFDAIYTEYATTFGKLPDASMASTMERVRLRLFDWWATHREDVRQAIATPPQQATNPNLVPATHGKITMKTSPSPAPKSRAAFEAWAARFGVDIRRITAAEDSPYWLYSTQFSWEVYLDGHIISDDPLADWHTCETSSECAVCERTPA